MPLDDKPQPDPALAERPARGTRIAVHAAAIVVILSTVFHGLNTSAGPTVKKAATPQSIETSETTPQSTSPNTAQNNASKPPAAPRKREVTPSNTQPGVTIGAASANSTEATNPQSSNTPAPTPPRNREFGAGAASIPAAARHSLHRRSFRRQTSHSARRRGGRHRAHRTYHSRRSHSPRVKSHSTPRAPRCRRR